MFDKNPDEHFIKEGNPNEPTYYIIRRMNENTELSDLYRMTMGHVCYALKKGWLPAVDMQNYPNLYLSPEKLGEENSWEYYFEQPFHIGLEQAYNSENVVLSNGDCVKPFPDYSMNLAQKKNDELVEWRMLIKMDLMRIKSELKEKISSMWEKVFSHEDIVLGVLLRGGNHPERKIKGHPIPPPPEFAANLISEKSKDWECNKILLATEDASIVELFRNNFGDKCVSLDQVYAVCYDTDEERDEEDSFRIKGEKDLLKMIFLSACNSFVAEKCGDTTGVILLAQKFEHVHFFNLGNY